MFHRNDPCAYAGLLSVDTAPIFPFGLVRSRDTVASCETPWTACGPSGGDHERADTPLSQAELLRRLDEILASSEETRRAVAHMLRKQRSFDGRPRSSATN
jgi:hypothetical protein